LGFLNFNFFFFSVLLGLIGNMENPSGNSRDPSSSLSQSPSGRSPLRVRSPNLRFSPPLERRKSDTRSPSSSIPIASSLPLSPGQPPHPALEPARTALGIDELEDSFLPATEDQFEVINAVPNASSRRSSLGLSVSVAETLSVPPQIHCTPSVSEPACQPSSAPVVAPSSVPSSIPSPFPETTHVHSSPLNSEPVHAALLEKTNQQLQAEQELNRDYQRQIRELSHQLINSEEDGKEYIRQAKKIQEQCKALHQAYLFAKERLAYLEERVQQSASHLAPGSGPAANAATPTRRAFLTDTDTPMRVTALGRIVSNSTRTAHC
jgi:hypothetical protein